MRWLLLILLLSATVPVPSSAQVRERRAPVATTLAGVYICDGVNPDGKPYRGVVQIEAYHDAYQVQWSFNREVAAVGIGIRSGDVLAVTYFSGVPGVVAYKIQEGSKLVGEWTVVGAEGTLFTETLTKASDDVPDASAEPKPEAQRPRPREPRGERERGKPVRGAKDI